MLNSSENDEGSVLKPNELMSNAIVNANQKVHNYYLHELVKYSVCFKISLEYWKK